jgi:hypothetical protein
MEHMTQQPGRKSLDIEKDYREWDKNYAYFRLGFISELI